MQKRLTYKLAGVNIDEAENFLKKIKPLVETTKRPEVIGTIGHFSGFFKVSDLVRSKTEPILVASCDGVGTKLLVAQILGKHETIGIDLVAMVVNDIVTCGANPLFFLDYLAIGKLNSQKAYQIIKGIVAGCKEANCVLLGGETAEMPGLYQKEDYDLAGFGVGVLNKKEMIDGSGVKIGNVVLGLASSGLHSNGYSLVRKVFSKKEIATSWANELLKPTKIYVRPILTLKEKVKIAAIAHITGGGFYKNIPRVLPQEVAVVINKGTWPIPRVFKVIQKRGNVEDSEMYRTFNMGIGMVIIVKKEETNSVKRILAEHRLKSWVIGKVIKGRKEVIFK